MKKSGAAILKEYEHFEWGEIEISETKDNEVLLQVAYACICGSDQHIFKGEFHPRTKLPLVPGHEFAGRIIRTGKDVRAFKPGDMAAVDPIIWCGECPACIRQHYPACTSLKLLGVDLDGGFSEYINVPESMLFNVPPHIPARHAALVELLSIGFHACNRAGIKENDSVVIWGAGKVGQSILQAVKTKSPGRVILVDILENRLKRALSAYPDIHTINSTRVDPVDKIREVTDGRGVDIAFEAVGHYQPVEGRENPVRSCIQSIRGAGTVCVLGLGDEPVPLLIKELIWKEATLTASRVTHGEFSEAIQMLDQGKLKPEALITDVLRPEEIQSGFEMLEKEPDNHLKILLEFSQ